MSISSSLSHLVPKKNKGFTSSEIAFQRLFFEAAAVITDKKLLKPLEREYNVLMHTTNAPRTDAQMLKLYFAVEDCVVTHEPPKVLRLYTRPLYRRDLAKAADLKTLPSVFAILFSPAPLDLVLTFQQILTAVSQYVVGKVGASILQTYISELTAGTILERTMTWQQSVPVFKSDKNTLAALVTSQATWEIAVKKLFDGLHTKLTYAGGEAFANVPFETWYQSFKALYGGDDIMTHVVAVLPTPITKADKVQYLTRRELVVRLGELTTQLKDTKEQGKYQIEEQTKKLQGELAQLRAYLNDVTCGVLVLDGLGNLILANDAFEQFYEKSKIANGTYSVEQFLSTHTLFKAGTTIPFPAEMFALTRALRGLTTVQDDIEIVVSGLHLHTRIHAIAHLTQEKVQYVVATFEDITHEVSLVRAKEYLLSAVLEELKNPISNLITAASLLPTRLDDQEKAALEIQSMGTSLSQALSQFQQVAAIELGTTPLKREVFDIIAHIKRAVAAYESQAQAKHISLRMNNETALTLRVVADKRRVREVLGQLIENALMHTDEGSIVVEINNDPHMVKVRVHDTGHGIQEEEQKLLFTMFQKLEDKQVIDPTTSQARAHTGLGLYIAKTLIGSMGGTIGLERSLPGQGSVFYFTLPIAKYM